MSIKRLINTSLERELPDLVLKNAKIVNVLTGEIINGDIAIADGIIVGTGAYSGKREINIDGKYAVPGFINSHVHVESSMVTPSEYALAELRCGTTTIITDPHEIVNVSGADAIKVLISAAKLSPINYFIMLPSCVPSTPFEHSGAILNSEQLSEFKNKENVLGLGEMMNTVGVLNCDEEVVKKLNAFSDKIIDGHSPLLCGKELNAYICAGIKTDHESISYEEAVEKIRCGMAVLIREGSASKNLEAIVSGIVKNNIDTRRFAFCTDDKHLADIYKDGTISYNIRKSISLGLSPIKAVQLATINAAEIYGLKNIGAIACGYKADIAILDNLEAVNVINVFKDGIPVSELKPKNNKKLYGKLLNTVNIAPIDTSTFKIPKKDKYNVIEIVENQILTKNTELTEAELQNGIKSGEILKIAVIERHHATGNTASAYIKGYGLKHGAVATTVAHDSHNIIVTGDNDSDMKDAVNELVRVHGGYAIVRDGNVIDVLALEAGGLMSLKKADELIPALDRIIQTAYSMGVNKSIDPFITLSFMALPVIPEIRITDCGLFDVNKFRIIQTS